MCVCEEVGRRLEVGGRVRGRSRSETKLTMIAGEQMVKKAAIMMKDKSD